ncbi:MAG: putative lipid II flippase FtsW [Limisphaerales bacterium]
MKVAVTTLAFCVAALISLGMVMLYSSSMTQFGAGLLVKQLEWFVVGSILCVTAAALDYQLLKKFAWPLFFLALFLLVGLFVPHMHGVRINGARRWYDFHGFRFQPSEFAKIALVAILAWHGDRCQRQMHTWGRGVFLPGLLIASILFLVFIEPDRGTTILLATVGGSLLLMAGTQWRHIFIPAALGVAGLTVSILHDPMRMRRIFSWWDLEQHKNGVGYQAYEAMIALGSGGWTGLGLGNSLQKLGFVPEHQTDFIFAIIGEELGLVATLAIVLAFVIIAVCGFCIAANARETFGFLLASGATLLICLQAAINIGVVTSALPNKGLPLPFISYGGSNLLAMLACVGFLFSVARHAPVREKQPDSSRKSSFKKRGDNPFAAQDA